MNWVMRLTCRAEQTVQSSREFYRVQSTGMGKMMVELCSAEMLLSVCGARIGQKTK